MNLQQGLHVVCNNFIQATLVASRWLQVPIYLALSLSLFAFIYVAFLELYQMFSMINTLSTSALIVFALTLCDMAFIANLIVIVIISGYENFITQINLKKSVGQPLWITELSYGDVKMKIALSLVAISSIHLLKQFLNIEQSFDQTKLMWHALIHVVFIVSVFILSKINIGMAKAK